MDSEYEPLIWNDAQFSYPGLVRIRTPGDGSCFFHAIAKAFFKPYQDGVLNGVPIDRKEFIKNFRHDLAYKLSEPISVNSNVTYYDKLSRGTLREQSKSYVQFNIEQMQKELDSNKPVDNLYNEFISDVLDKDIYLLDGVKRNVYITGKDSDILIKGRSSIVILVLPGHYELIGIKLDNDNIKTLFEPDDDLIRSIKNHI